MIQVNVSTKHKHTHRHRERTCGCQGGDGWRRDRLGVWDQWVQLLYTGWNKKQGPTVQHRELYPISWINHNGNIDIHIYTHSGMQTLDSLNYGNGLS